MSPRKACPVILKVLNLISNQRKIQQCILHSIDCQKLRSLTMSHSGINIYVLWFEGTNLYKYFGTLSNIPFQSWALCISKPEIPLHARYPRKTVIYVHQAIAQTMKNVYGGILQEHKKKAKNKPLKLYQAKLTH